MLFLVIILMLKMRDELKTKIMKAKNRARIKAVYHTLANLQNFIRKILHIVTLFYVTSFMMLLTFFYVLFRIYKVIIVIKVGICRDIVFEEVSVQHLMI